MLYLFASCPWVCVLFYFLSWLIKKLKGAEENPKSDCNSPQTKYDVFVSFRGEDIRRGLLSHMIESFQRNKINAFVDDKLEREDEIWSSLVRAIEGSLISLIIFSEDYASSHWCLDELVTILECREKYGQIVIPVYYHVNPTDIRHQLGSYEIAFADQDKVQIWRSALNKSANLCGIQSSKFRNGDHSTLRSSSSSRSSTRSLGRGAAATRQGRSAFWKRRNDAELLKEIVNFVLTKLGKSLG